MGDALTRLPARAAPAATTVGTGVLLMMLAMLLVMPTNDATVKHLAASLPAGQLAWARFFFNFVLLAPLALWRYRRRALTPARPGLQALRGVLIVASNILFITGLRFVPLADATAIVLVAPLAVAALSPFVLGEKVGPGGWAAVALGFAGALVIVRPGSGATGPAALLPLGAGLTFAAYLLVTRRLAGGTPPVVTQATTAAVGAVLTTLLLLLDWVSPSPLQWAMMVAIGCGSCVGHLLITTAHEHAPASTLAPFTYLGIVSATALGYLLFGDWPPATTWAGAATVIASGLGLWWQARRG